METSGPHDAELVRSFVNSVHLEDAVDELARPADLRAWLRRQGIASARLKVTAADLAQARRLREALRALIGVNDGEPLDPAEHAILDGSADRADLRVRFHADGSATTAPGCDGVDAALGEILAAAHRAMGDGSWRRLKLCRRSQCRWAIYDTSKNQSRRWCSMETCGNREKGAAFRRRHAGDPA